MGTGLTTTRGSARTLETSLRLVSLRYDDEGEEEENQCEMMGTIRMMIRMNCGVRIRMSENFVDLIDVGTSCI